MNWRLSPSDFAFLWEECKRCFYLKLARQFERPRTPMPKIFIKIDSMMKGHFAGKNTIYITPELPPGVVDLGERWVQSKPIEVPGHTSTCFIRGKFDTVVKFEDGSYGVIDFKTSESKSEHVPLYGRQLHAYSYALENAAPGALSLSPVSRLGLLCVEPAQMVNLNGSYAYKGEPAWIEVPKDNGSFMEFLGRVLDVLEQPEPPGGSATCPWCQYRDTARRTRL